MDQEWIILDTETDGIAPPIHVIEIAAQRMRGWEKVGETFVRLLDHSIDIPDKASAIHGYTRAILERDGHPPQEVYRELRDFVRGLPVVSYNLRFDWDQVLLPEWERLGLDPIGKRGFCALELARRLLGTLPSGNFKLQTLRRYFNLPERAAHSADGDVLATADLATQVLGPAAIRQGLHTWDALVAKAEEDWYPQRIPFGKHKGRDFQDANTDNDLRSWLEWLAKSGNEKSGKMGNWYLANLDTPPPPPVAFEAQGETTSGQEPGTQIAVWQDQEADGLRRLVEAARDRLAGLETELASVRSKVDQVRASVFQALRPLYEKRDLLRLKVEYRKMFLDTLLAEGEEEAENVESEYKEREEGTRRQYEETAHALEDKHALTKEEEEEVNRLWKKLVRLYHPDKFHNDPAKREAYEKLTAEINHARDTGDIQKLREIAADPDAYLARMGLDPAELHMGKDSLSIRKTWEALQARILETLEEIDALRSGPDHELYELLQKDASILDTVIANLSSGLQETISGLEGELEKLEAEIEDLMG
jgi:DNA polymerase III epsilon subunit-like protein